MKNLFNLEWTRIVIDYLSVSDKKDKNFEVVLPVVISVCTAFSYYLWGDIHSALKKFCELLINVDSILIGFTGILVTLLLTTDNKNITSLKEKKVDKKIYGKNATLYDLLHILFTNALLNEIVLLLIIMFNLFMMGLIKLDALSLIGLIVEVFMILNISFSMMRGVTNLYWTLMKK